MRIAVLSAEAVPFSKTGGLGDVAGALPKALRSVGADAFLITPFYNKQTDGNLINQVAIEDFRFGWKGRDFQAKVYYSEAGGAPTFLIDAPEYFWRDSIYGYTEDYERFAFFSHAALELIRRLGAPPDIVHLNDWHTGFAAVKLAHLRFWDSYWRDTRTVFSIHNLAYQGAFDAGRLWELGFGSDFEKNAFAFNGHASAMKGGLETADMLSTVSRTYGYEIQQSENGYGLNWLLRKRADRLFGIVNGVDYDIWNPETDAELPAHFNSANFTGKQMCKQALLEKFFLPADLEKPVFAVVTRLTAQKGFELIQQIAGEILATGAYFIALGSGNKSYENFLQSLRDAAPSQVGVYTGYNESLAHLIEAGADIFLMPSKFEPCGLNQMYSLRYGTVPIVRAVGGLQDTVEDFDRLRGTGTGFKFKEFRADKFLEKIYEALFTYQDKDVWRRLKQNGMAADNSWQNAARNYLQLYSITKGV